ncbi:MAG: hypothetical protein AAB366_03215 [Patescibacteria group bacterium]
MGRLKRWGHKSTIGGFSRFIKSELGRTQIDIAANKLKKLQKKMRQIQKYAEKFQKGGD